MFNVTIESRGSQKNVRRHPLVVIEIMQIFAHHDQLELRSGDLMVHYSGFILKLFQSSFVMFLF